MNAFHSTNLFCCFSRYQAPANSVAPSFCIETTHNPQFLDSLRRRANAGNVSFRISLRWLTYIVNSVDKTKLSCMKFSWFEFMRHKAWTKWQSFSMSHSVIEMNQYPLRVHVPCAPRYVLCSQYAPFAYTRRGLSRNTYPGVSWQLAFQTIMVLILIPVLCREWFSALSH